MRHGFRIQKHDAPSPRSQQFFAPTWKRRPLAQLRPELEILAAKIQKKNFPNLGFKISIKSSQLGRLGFFQV